MHCMPYFSSESVRESFSRKISPSLGNNFLGQFKKKKNN